MNRIVGSIGSLVVGLSLAGAAPALAAEKDPAPASPHGAWAEDCSLCHSDTGWTPARVSSKFRHAPSRFPLEGAHGQTTCRACHKSLDFASAKPPVDCVTCHQDVHHGEFGADCGRCHSSRSFIDHARMIRAHQTTRFPLAGAHVAADCEGCHGPPAAGHLSYVNLSPACESCHMAEYLATVSPPHQAAGFPAQCALCHAPTGWLPTSSFNFDHAATGFPLTGAHRTQPCASCHGGGVYQGLSPDCVSCHQQDYDRTADPPHASSGFTTDCRSCHGTSAWRPSSFDHGQFFPIYSGAHQGKWSACSDCHTVAGNFAQFSCWGGCHEHENAANMADKHSGVSGYVHDSLACYNCHPRGN